MAGRTQLVEGMQNILGKQWFIYGGYESRPEHLPYGNYGEIPGETRGVFYDFKIDIFQKMALLPRV